MEGRNATVPLRQHLRDTELIPGRVVSIDHANRTAVVEPTDNGEPFELKYDEIVLGAGAVTRAFPIPGLAEVAIGLKTIEEAVSVRNWVLDRIEVASMLSDAEERRRALTSSSLVVASLALRPSPSSRTWHALLSSATSVSPFPTCTSSWSRLHRASCPRSPQTVQRRSLQSCVRAASKSC